MGSSSFSQTHYTTSDYKQAYNDLVTEARDEYGYDAYNGTISTTSGVDLVPTDRPLTQAEAEKIMEKRIHNLSKWENVEAIALVAPESVKERKVVRKVKITAKQIKEAGSLRDALLVAAEKSVTLRDGEIYQGFRVNQENYRDKSSLKYRGVMVPTEGKAVIRYFIVRDGYMNNFEWKNGFATMAAARKRLTEIVNAEADGYRHFSDTVAYEIVGQTRREDGSPLLRATREVSGAEYEITVTVAKIAAKPKAGGFLFYGWAAE
jgi:hypothetical protein